MTTEPFKRITTRSFAVAQDFPIIVAVAGIGESLKSFYKLERDAGKICIILSEDSDPQLNTSSIALADELLILNLSGDLSNFQTAMLITAQTLDKHIRVLRD